MLTEIYSWFTEGFDTADLKDAKALLEELRNIKMRCAKFQLRQPGDMRSARNAAANLFQAFLR